MVNCSTGKTKIEKTKGKRSKERTRKKRLAEEWDEKEGVVRLEEEIKKLVPKQSLVNLCL